MSYCTFCKDLDSANVNKVYHDHFYGFPIDNDDELFGRLILEINQAGLSWQTILKKEENFRRAYSNYSIERIANYDEDERSRLLNDAGIIRNKLKINAAIYNAQKVLEIKRDFNTFKNWLDIHHPLNREEWTKLFKITFKFVGGEIVNEFLMSTGYLKGAHDEDCPINKKIERLNPKWMQKRN